MAECKAHGDDNCMRCAFSDRPFRKEPRPPRIAIIGSRRRDCRRAVVRLVNKLPKGTVVVSGGCRGVDQWAEAAARLRGLKVKIFRPKLAPGGAPYYAVVQAMYARNQRVAKYADEAYAFVAEDRTGGTENTIKYFKQLHKKVHLR